MIQEKFIRKISVLLFMIIIAFIISCSTVSISGDWKDVKYKPLPLKKIVVIAMFKNLPNQTAVENKIVSYLKSGGTDAVSSLAIIGPDKKYKYEEMESRFKANGIDGILIIKLKNINSKEKYIRGSIESVSDVYETPYYGFYSSSYREIYEPGHYEETDYVSLDCMMYANDTDRLVWMAQLKLIEDYITEDGITDPEKESRSIAALIINNLKKNNIIK